MRMSYERIATGSPYSLEEREEREERRVYTNAFIKDVDQELFTIMETPPCEHRSDQLLGLCVSLAREHHLQQLCYQVEGLIDPESPLDWIDVDHPEGVTENPLTPVTGISEENLMEAIDLGKREATGDLLGLLVPSDNDLIRTIAPIDPPSQKVLDIYATPWKRDLLKAADLESLHEFTSGLKYYEGGIMILNLKTRLPTVDLSLVYPAGKQAPQRYLYATGKI